MIYFDLKKDNIQKIENSFIKPGVDVELDNKIITLLDSQDQIEACRSYFSNIISLFPAFLHIIFIVCIDVL